MRSSDGFILLMTLIMMSIMSLLVLTSMQHLLLYYKAFNSIKAEQNQFYQMESAAMQLVAPPNTEQGLACIKTQDNPNDILELLKSNKGCTFTKGTFNFRYVLEDLGEFPCLIIHKNEKKYASKQIRLSVMIPANKHQSGAIMQIRRIISAAKSSCVQGVEVEEGVISWRYLPT